MLYLRLRVAAHQLVTLVRGPLKSTACAARGTDTSRMRMTSAHWLLLMTTERETFGSPRSTRAGTSYEVLKQILAQHSALAVGQDAPAEPAEVELADRAGRRIVGEA
ncbi:hypothetical protein [Streptomyces sp. NPDC048106]|uniref:hypothetical protein n=1 Tax=Streptomyces sp. NPDC048106 TaxID=3155750 RepID=UPI003452B2B8